MVAVSLSFGIDCCIVKAGYCYESDFTLLLAQPASFIDLLTDLSSAVTGFILASENFSPALSTLQPAELTTIGNCRCKCRCTFN